MDLTSWLSDNSGCIAMKPLFVETLVMLRVLAIASLSVTALTLTALGALAKPAAMVETIKLGEVEAA